MTYKQAVKMAIACVEKERHSLAVDANLANLFGAKYPHAMKASKRRKELEEVIRILEFSAV